MSELRQDRLTGRWVLIAADRAGRPDEFLRTDARRLPLPCPFCAGYEHETAPLVAQYGADPWQVRVVENRYPAVQPQGDSPATGEHESGNENHSVGAVQSALGRHEVVIESPSHVASFTELTDEQAQLTLIAYRDRLRYYRREGRWRFAMAFKNVGVDAGASIEHSHSQLIALPMAPPTLELEYATARQHYRRVKTCLFCDQLARELAAGRRIIAAHGPWVAYCPYASRFPFEVTIAPRPHAGHFDAASDVELGELAGLLKEVIGRMEQRLDRPGFNYWIHTAPFDRSAADHYHWHVEIMPRTTRPAGFEWGAGMFVNPVPPEEAAQALLA